MRRPHLRSRDKLGTAVSACSIRRYRRRGPARPPSQSWRTFLANRAQGIWAADLFVVQTLTFQTLYVLFLISHDRRRLVHFNVTAHPTAAWVWRQMIEATPWAQHPKYLIHDRDRAYGADFATRIAWLGIESIRTPTQAPWANAIGERVVRILRRESLDHILPLSERHVRSVLAEFVTYYNQDRPHRSLALETPGRVVGWSAGRWSLGLSSEACTTSMNEPPDPESSFAALQHVIGCVAQSRASFVTWNWSAYVIDRLL